MNALIGYSGFVGGVLKEKIKGELYNSSNIELIKKKNFDNVYCAGVSGTKWIANKNPKEDISKINILIDCVRHVKCNKFILISTISVYDNEHYGINRKNLEETLFEIFGDKLLIIRLPAIYGKGIKKNLLFDMLNNKIDLNINLLDTYQWYDITDLTKDIKKFLKNKYKIVELFPEPISNEILISLFNKNFKSYKENTTSYVQNIIPVDGYFYTKNKVIKKLKKFIDGYN
jgi:hypothetical protein